MSEKRKRDDDFTVVNFSTSSVSVCVSPIKG